MTNKNIILGIDVGGTFTDFASLNLDKMEFNIFKTSTTPEDCTIGIIKGIIDNDINLYNVSRICHGTTVVTNAVIQREGVSTLLLTTKSFRDVLEIRRTTRGELYNIHWDPPEPIIPRYLRLELDERIDTNGNIIKKIQPNKYLDIIDNSIKKFNIKSIAISFINSFSNNHNELLLKNYLLQKYSDIFIITSSEILPVWREFERTSTTCIAAYVGPIILDYINNLRDELNRNNFKSNIYIMLSNGGSSTPENIKPVICQTVLSGPVAGVIASKELLSIVKEKNIINMDIGGTSTDISIINNGDYLLTDEYDIEFGTVVYMPAIDVNTIGAGGGSIAWIDSMGVLRVGPKSAGSNPGPACYDKGNLKPTVTDANVVLGRLNPDFLLNGSLRINNELSIKAIKEEISDKLKISIFEAAKGIIDVACNNIANAISQRTIQKGLNPKDFLLYPFGGAGPLLSSEVAEILEIPKIIVPLYPGVNSALGLTFTDIRHDFMKTFVKELNINNIVNLKLEFENLEKTAINSLTIDSNVKEKLKIVRTIDLRYDGQTHELNISLNLNSTPEELMNDIRIKFNKKHLSEFGHAKELDYPVEIVNLRIALIRITKKPIWPKLTNKIINLKSNHKRRIYSNIIGGCEEIPVYYRHEFFSNLSMKGPAIIEQYDSTTYLKENQNLVVDEYGNMVITWI